MPETPETPPRPTDADPAGSADGAEPSGTDGTDDASAVDGADTGADAEEPGDGDADAAGTDPLKLVEEAILAAAGRATLPFQAARADRSFATAFWYNDFVETGSDHEVIRQYLVTAEARTRFALGQFTLRPGLVAPELPADELVLPSFAKKWTRLGDLGVAVMPTTDLHIHAEKRGWHWTTDEVTAGLAAQPADIALIGVEPLPAYVLGHAVDEESGGKHPERPQVLLAGAVTRTSDDPTAPVRWTTPLPEGFAGAPVFAALPMDDDQVKLVCLGLVLPAARPAAETAQAPDGAPATSTPSASATVVTFDLLRPAVHAVTPPRKRHWWQRF
ncbi:hypothetical protein SAMN05216267_1006153 [Actinacidiphila rubida]|uniref:Uncharacterized protein n=1 Tax=Actinacidiphila rubida TaxID=310780 RepID=A0A1H8HCZ6_9ACTN|nr:hypothetical protein [Actinacidiphila rubida]SEN53398.1 hypothetical protein SAMN05216267_1006153 [Actinacidiphila rubida]